MLTNENLTLMLAGFSYSGAVACWTLVFIGFSALRRMGKQEE